MFNALEASLDSRAAAVMMAHLPPAGYADLATRADIDGLRSELKGEMAELRAEVRSQLPKLVAANIASMIGVAGLVLGAASLAH